MTKLLDRLETIDCRKDTKARRVSNAAPDKVANITADQLEAGMTLEAIEGLNVPAFAYQTQMTIHGKLPAFDLNARPGGYKAVFLNGNGSVGVRYGAIDTAKKALLARAARVSQSGWNTSSNSTGFSLSRSFSPRWENGFEVEGSRETAKQNTLAALRSLPVARFYGSAFAGVLAYGLGYYVDADIGAIPANEVWPLIADVFGVNGEADLIARETVKKAGDDAKHAEWQKEYDERAVRHKEAQDKARADLAAYLSTLPGKRLDSVPRESGFSFIRYRFDRKNDAGQFAPLAIEIKKRGAVLCYSVNGGKFKACKSTFSTDIFPRWNEAAKRGEILANGAGHGIL